MSETKYYLKKNELSEKDFYDELKRLDIDPNSYCYIFNAGNNQQIIADYISLKHLGFDVHYSKEIIIAEKINNVEWKTIAAHSAFDNHHRPSDNEITFGKKSLSFLSTGNLKYTFGCEWETCRGFVPHRIPWNLNLNLKCERDGSLRDPDGAEYGGEYISGVLTGDTGMKQVYDILAVLSKRCLIDKRCGLHVHVGGFINNQSFLVTAYYLANKIQDELMQVVSPSRRNNDTCGLLIDETEAISNFIEQYGYHYGIKEAYSYLFNKLANQRELDAKVNKDKEHPGGRYTERYTGIEGRPPINDIKKLYRYKIINFIPTAFNMRKAKPKDGKLNNGIPYTVEFRNHQGTLNYKKTKCWVLLCMAFVHYVENYSQEILNKKHISLNDIISAAYSKNFANIEGSLKRYFEKRKAYFIECDNAETVEYGEKSEYTENTSIKKLITTIE